MRNQHVNRILVLCLIAALCAFGSTAMAAGRSTIIEKNGALSNIKPNATASPSQLKTDAYFNEMFAKYGDFSTWSYELKAESSQKLAEFGAEPGVVVFGLPGASDISEDEAIRLAKEAIVTKFLLTDETMQKFRIGTSFVIANPNYWSVEFNPINVNDYSEIGAYLCHLSAANGSVIKIFSAADAVG
jgi:hypothetical protein